MEVRVLEGDIASIEADALITAINSGGMWFGGIDRVIADVAGDMFHSQAAQRFIDLVDGATIVASATCPHSGRFDNVVFVVDDLQRPLHDIVMAGLRAADKAGFKSVTLPTIRMGVMLGAVENSTEEAVREMALGVKASVRSLKNLESVTFVVYANPVTADLLRTALSDWMVNLNQD